MLERLVEQKTPIVAALEHERKALLLQEDQWTLAANIICVLAPFEETTIKLCLKSACISQIIPFIQILGRGLECSLSDSILVAQKHQMLIIASKCQKITKSSQFDLLLAVSCLSYCLLA